MDILTIYRLACLTLKSKPVIQATGSVWKTLRVMGKPMAMFSAECLADEVLDDCVEKAYDKYQLKKAQKNMVRELKEVE